ncbi:MAG TPA: MBL fold metallo-hydrolase [Anaeromyxobacteraceae bacterium]|nr:MBL fold metallo-hydrolase [Anaeromyxobacteraceae bacterium]
MLIVRTTVVGPFAANCYLLGCSNSSEAVLVDPGGDPTRVLGMVEPGGLRITRIVCTHGHIDHVAGAVQVQEATGAPFQIHAADTVWLEQLPQQAATFGFDEVSPPKVDRFHEDGEIFRVGQCDGVVLHTPGHTRGSCSLWFPRSKVLVTGDTLFAGSVGRTDLPGGDFAALERSIRDKLFPLGDDVRFYPGHGPASFIGQERLSNPFVGEEVRRGRFL